MRIQRIEIFKLPLPMEPFVIATEVATVAQNTFLRIHAEGGPAGNSGAPTRLTGKGECSAFPMLTGETQGTCFEVAKELARLLKGKDPLDLQARMDELDAHIAFNTTIKSAFDMALHDLAAKAAGLPLYRFLGGERRTIESDITVGIGEPGDMAAKAERFVAQGARAVKIKVGKDREGDIERVRRIRETVGPAIALRIDANQGWDFDTAAACLQAMGAMDIQFCEQPLHHREDGRLPALRGASPVPIMADESVFDHHDALRLIQSGGIDSINVKLAKSGGILEARRIADAAQAHGVPCMLGGMLESRLGLTAKVHLAMAHRNFVYFDLDTCLLGQLEDPVIGGARYEGFRPEVPEEPGIAADIRPDFLAKCEGIEV